MSQYVEVRDDIAAVLDACRISNHALASARRVSARLAAAEGALRDVGMALNDPLCDPWTRVRIQEMPRYSAVLAGNTEGQS